MKYWKAHYTDEQHGMDIEIRNTEGEWRTEPLSFTINGISFSGSTLQEFSLSDPSCYETAKQEFCIQKWGGNYSAGGGSTEYHYTLQRYTLDAEIPVTLIRKADGTALQAQLHVRVQKVPHDPAVNQAIVRCDNERVYPDDVCMREFSLHVDGQVYAADSPDTDFETCLLQIIMKIHENYALHCCFTCQYSDYSPYGNDDFGTMLCYRAHKAEYLKVNSKDDFFRYVYHLDFQSVQETFLCDEYETRSGCSGYRGYTEPSK